MVVLTGACPIFELRGAIPLGLSFFGKEHLLKILLLSIAGNIIPIPLLLVFLMPVSERLKKLGIFKKFFDWLFERTKKKADLIQKYEALGLAIFVGIPLPMTGAWTGAIAASLFNMRFRFAFMSITAGILIAAIIVTILCLTGMMTWELIK